MQETVEAKTAILIDGAFFLKRLPHVRSDIDASDPQDVVKAIEQLIRSHLDQLGQVTKPRDRSWTLKPKPQGRLLRGDVSVSDLKDYDFSAHLRQKGVDMRIGLDIASITLKKQANIIVLVSGDSDFVPAAKLARREGVNFILDPLWQRISPDLSEHIDTLTSGFSRPQPDPGTSI